MAFLLLSAALTGNAAIAEDGAPSAVTANIVGRQTVVANVGYKATYRFPEDPIRVAQGGTITFVNKTDDFHTIALVNKADLPVPFNGKAVDAGPVQNNCAICNAVNQTFGAGNGPPSGLQIDNGTITDDDGQADADVTDTAAIASATHLPPGLTPMVADFDTPGSGGVTPTVGDATIIATKDSGAPTVRTVKMTAAPGTYYYICTFHPWMEGKIIVEPAS
jgi:plastocyanin